jgi:mono/diheme cytochrome c family protein
MSIASFNPEPTPARRDGNAATAGIVLGAPSNRLQSANCKLQIANRETKTCSLTLAAMQSSFNLIFALCNLQFAIPRRTVAALPSRRTGVGSGLNKWRLVMLAAFVPLAGCHRDMQDQPRYDTYEASSFFDNGMSARPLIEGTVARGQLNDDEPYYFGRENGQPITALPHQVTANRALLERGRERYTIYCSMCHSRLGDGNGMVVQRGFRKPPSYHIERLREAPAGHFFDVITNGFGAMPSLKSQIPVEDRWAIVAYIRALQLSQDASLDDVPDEERAKLESASSDDPSSDGLSSDGGETERSES